MSLSRKELIDSDHKILKYKAESAGVVKAIGYMYLQYSNAQRLQCEFFSSYELCLITLTILSNFSLVLALYGYSKSLHQSSLNIGNLP